MKAEQICTRATFILIGVLLALLLAGCRSEATETPFTVSGPDPLQSTVESLAAENKRLSTEVAGLSATLQNPPTATPTVEITSTPTPTLTPTPGPTIAVPDDVLSTTHQSAPGYVFLADPETWTVGSTTAPAEDFLLYTEVNDCKINIAPAEAPGEIRQYYPRILGRRSWLVEVYEDAQFYIHKDLRLQPSISEDEDCIAAQDVVLTEILTTDEFNGAPVTDVAVQPTQRPTPGGFVCEKTQPPRLAVGDRALITAGFLWLRDEARVNDETEVKLYTQYAPAEITVTKGPVCADDFVFWEVTLREFGETGDTYTGWMAESGANEYYLDVWYLGW